MNDCVFCKIVRGDLPSRKVHHEEGHIVSFPDINQKTPGHTLVVPTEHFRWFYDLPDELANKLFRAARHVAVRLKEETGADFVQMSVVGEAVPHVHVHLLPRKLTDQISL